MTEISRAALFGKLDPLAYRAIEGATTFCRLRGNPYVELEHWFVQILQQPDSDLHRLFRHYEVESDVLAADLTRALDRLPRGAQSISDLSAHIEDCVERAWVYGSLMFGARSVRTGHLLLGALKTRNLRNVLLGISRQFDKISADDLASKLPDLVRNSPEEADAASTTDEAGSGAGDGTPGSAALGKQEALKKYAVDLTERARKGEIDPVVGRDEEIRQIVDILMRRRQNNPLLTGEAGVGKTAVVEGFAVRLAKGDVPPQLRDTSLFVLDVGLLQAGASMKGEFENRLRQVIDEVQSSAKPIILFIDEAHTLVGAGGAAGTGDAANLLKPALARGKLRTIGATTWAEYKKHIEKDPALTRRFQVVQIPEPDEAKAVLMLRGVASTLEAHHRVQLLDEAIGAAVRLSHRYIPARQLPDKAVSLLDTACARVAVSQHATPAELEDCQRRIEALTIESEIIEREGVVGIDVDARRTKLAAQLEIENAQRVKLEARFAEEKALVDKILDLRRQLREKAGKVDETPAAAVADPEVATLMAELTQLQGELSTMQGDTPLVLPSVDSQAVATVVQDWTGIPVGRMVKNEITAVLQLADTLNKRVIGQKHALDMIARRIQTSRARLDNPNKPIGVFLLCGTSGVGKTETALALAESLYGGEQNIVTINMSEFQEAHTVSTLKGSPPGYVGYGEGGVLTEAVRRKPYSVVLLDEVEKAHSDVHELFFQVFDKGWMEDGEGRDIDFRNTIILLTSNAGSDLIMNLCKDPELIPEPDQIAIALREPLLKIFPAALLCRVVVIPYFPLSEEMLGNVVKLQLERIKKRVEANHGVPFEYDNDVVKLVVNRCNEVESGGRIVDAILTNTVLPRVSIEYLTRLSEGKSIERVKLGVADNDFTYSFD
ncbi:type VI secretion system ATPase TssH [soil metagenome]